MVEINNQRKAFLDMLAWSEGADNGRQKTRNHGYDVIVGKTVTDYSDHPLKLVTLNPKLNQQAPDATGFFPVGGMPTASSLAWKTSLRKSGCAASVQQIRERGALPMMIVVISVRQSTVTPAISGLHCRALVMVSSSIRLTAWLQIQRSGRNGQRDWCIAWSHRDYLRSGYLHHRLPVMGC